MIERRVTPQDRLFFGGSESHCGGLRMVYIVFQSRQPERNTKKVSLLFLEFDTPELRLNLADGVEYFEIFFFDNTWRNQKQ